MNEEVKNRKIVIGLIFIMLFIVLVFVVYSVLKKDRNDLNKDLIKINQVYSSDYDLTYLGDNYFIGSYENNVINVIINQNGQEIYEDSVGINYDSYYKTKDGKYLIYNNIDNKLNIYLFDGKVIEQKDVVDKFSYVKPIIYKKYDIEYIVGFMSILEDDFYLYDLSSGNTVLIEDSLFMGDYIENGIYYVYSDKYLVVKNNENFMGVIDFDGNIIVDFKYKNIVNTYSDSFVALSKKDKYGIIDINEKKLVKFNNKAIDCFENGCLVVNSNNKMALYDYSYANVTDFVMNYNTLIEYDLRSKNNSVNLYTVGDKKIVVNNYLEAKNGIEYDKHSLYIINNNEIVKNIKQVGFGATDVLFTYDENFNINIFDNEFIELFSIKIKNLKKIENIEYVSKDIVCIKYLNNEEKSVLEYYDLNGEKVDFNLGEVVIKHENFYGYIKNDRIMKLSLYDIDGEVLDNISGNNISIFDDFIIVDNAIYHIDVKKG